MSNHTPGPWAVVEGDSPGIKEISGPSFTILAVMWASDLNEDDFRKRYADLSLIAAAPEVVNSAETLLNLHMRALNGDVADAVQWDVAVLNLKTDIAKAKGETG